MSYCSGWPFISANGLYCLHVRLSPRCWCCYCELFWFTDTWSSTFLLPSARPTMVSTLAAKCTYLLALAFVRLGACQSVALAGRFLPLGSSQNSSSLPTAVSWPASQISASFAGSSAVTAVVKDLTYATTSQLALLPAGLQLLVNGAGTAAVNQSQDMFFFTIGNLPGTSATVTLTKQDESVLGRPREAFLAPKAAGLHLP